MDERGCCTKPDRDNPKLVCGYPIPCPHHTVIIDPPDVIVPPTANLSLNQSRRLAEICKALSDD